jgi:hypothetical protein
MSYQIDLHKPRSLLIPLTESAQRNLLLQQASRLSAATPAQLLLATLATQQPVDRRRADAQQLHSHFWLKLELAEILESADYLRHYRHQALAANVIQYHPDLPQFEQHLLVINLAAFLRGWL